MGFKEMRKSIVDKANVVSLWGFGLGTIANWILPEPPKAGEESANAEEAWYWEAFFFVPRSLLVAFAVPSLGFSALTFLTGGFDTKTVTEMVKDPIVALV